MVSGVGRRFDFEKARAEARAAKKAARIRKIVSNAVLVVVLVTVVVGGKIGWDWWQEKRRAEAEAAEAARLEEERAQAEKRRVENERRAAEEAQRAAARKAQEEAREAERKAREEARRAQEEAREAERLKAEEERKREAAERVEQQELRPFCDKIVQGLRFTTDTHLVYEAGLYDAFDANVDEKRWLELSTTAQMRQTIDFFEMLRTDSITNDFGGTRYPDRATVKELLAGLDKERFTLVVTFTELAKGKRLTLVGADIDNGLAVPAGCRELKDGARVRGWTVPFAFGDPHPMFVMTQRTADRLCREWASFARKIRNEAAKLSNRDEYVKTRLEKELPDFIRSVKVEIQTPPPEEKKVDKTQERRAPKATMKGMSDIRKMNGPQLRQGF